MDQKEASKIVAPLRARAVRDGFAIVTKDGKDTVTVLANGTIRTNGFSNGDVMRAATNLSKSLFGSSFPKEEGEPKEQ